MYFHILITSMCDSSSTTSAQTYTTSSLCVGEASFKPWRKTLDPPTPPPLSSLTHQHGQGPIREDRVIENESAIILQKKQREWHLLNVRQQDNRKKTVKVSSFLSPTRLLYSICFTVLAEWGKFEECCENELLNTCGNDCGKTRWSDYFRERERLKRG